MPILKNTEFSDTLLIAILKQTLGLTFSACEIPSGLIWFLEVYTGVGTELFYTFDGSQLHWPRLERIPVWNMLLSILHQIQIYVIQAVLVMVC